MDKKKVRKENSLHKHADNLSTAIYKVIKYNTSDGMWWQFEYVNISHI